MVGESPIESNGLLKKVDFNALPLIYFNALIGIDWLERHKSKVDCHEKFLECIKEKGRTRVVKG